MNSKLVFFTVTKMLLQLWNTYCHHWNAYCHWKCFHVTENVISSLKILLHNRKYFSIIENACVVVIKLNFPENYHTLAEPTPGFAWENSISSSHPPRTSCCPCASTSPWTIVVVSFGITWSGHSPALPISWQWWQLAASWQVKLQLGLPGLLSSLSTSTDSLCSLLQPLKATDKYWYHTAKSQQA